MQNRSLASTSTRERNVWYAKIAWNAQDSALRASVTSQDEQEGMCVDVVKDVLDALSVGGVKSVRE